MTAEPVPDAPVAPVMGIWCAAAHPLDPSVLCRKLRHGRKVLHASDGQEHWPTPTTDEDQR